MSCLNINIGILGHVDSGKTTLAKRLSQIGSTAAFDKSKQSQEHGITLDLGFSALRTPIPSHFLLENEQQELQLTFVDCPGHASLLKTIIGGAQIIDFIILVVDVTKGIQTQTAECLVIGEITCPGKMIVALNKIDLLESGEKRQILIEKVCKKLKIVLSTTVFKETKVIPISASENELNNFLEMLKQEISLPKRDNIHLSFLFAVDHCFQITGQGTICTGTILQGKISVGEELEIPKLGLRRKVKSIQMFRKSTREAQQGDRVGICLTQFSHNEMERGILAAPGCLRHIYVAVLKVNQIKYFKQTIKAKSKLHMSIGHETVLGKVLFFVCDSDKPTLDTPLLYHDSLEPVDTTDNPTQKSIFVIIEFDRPVLVASGMLVIASNMTEVHKNSCRLAFYGYREYICDDREYLTSFLPKFKIYKEKVKMGSIQRVVHDTEVIGINLFKKESDRQLYIGLKIELTTGETGVIESTFGQTNKIKVRLNESLKKDTKKLLEKRDEVRIILKYKKFIFEKSNKRIRQ